LLLGGSATAVAAIAVSRWMAVVAVVVLAGSHLLLYRAVEAGTSVIAAHSNSLFSSAIMAMVFWWYLRREGSLLDTANERALTAEAHRARYAERIAHHRALHDTVLATLTTIAGGGIDANTPKVRERCAREAAYLRRLIQQTVDGESNPEVGAALEEAVRAAESLDLRVSTQYSDLPTVPDDVAAAMAEAVTEALNNIRRHAGTGHGFLTATGDGGHLTITVVDQGKGFDRARTSAGLGLDRSIEARVREIGGLAAVDSRPGEGTRVELKWPG
jgi:signal transduction histidine kinase